MARYNDRNWGMRNELRKRVRPLPRCIRCEPAHESSLITPLGWQFPTVCSCASQIIKFVPLQMWITPCVLGAARRLSGTTHAASSFRESESRCFSTLRPLFWSSASLQEMGCMVRVVQGWIMVYCRAACKAHLPLGLAGQNCWQGCVLSPAPCTAKHRNIVGTSAFPTNPTRRGCVLAQGVVAGAGLLCLACCACCVLLCKPP